MSSAAIPLILLLQLTGSKMQEHTIIPDPGPLGLDGEQYWQKPLEQASVGDTSLDLLAKEGRGRGIYIDAPFLVLLDKHKTVPVIALNSNSTADVARFGLKQTGQILVVHLETGIITMSKAAESPVPDPDRPEPGPGWVVEELETDAAEAGLGPSMGRYAVSILNGPEASDSRMVYVFPSEAVRLAPETRAALNAMRHEGGTLPLVSLKALRLLHAPPPPPHAPLPPPQGLAWKLMADPDGARGHRVRLDFRITGLPRFVHPKDAPVLDDEGRRVEATLPVFLAAFDQNRVPIFARQLGLPAAASPWLSPERPALSGRLSFDLETLMQAKPGAKITLWAFAMDRMASLNLAW